MAAGIQIIFTKFVQLLCKCTNIHFHSTTSVVLFLSRFASFTAILYTLEVDDVVVHQGYDQADMIGISAVPVHAIRSPSDTTYPTINAYTKNLFLPWRLLETILTTTGPSTQTEVLTKMSLWFQLAAHVQKFPERCKMSAGGRIVQLEL